MTEDDLTSEAAREAEFNRGISLRDAGQMSQSLAVLENLLAVRIRANGADHFDCQVTASQRARTLRAMGRFAEATETHWDVLLVRERLYGANHSYTVNSAGILEETLRMAGNAEAAELIKLAQEFSNLGYAVCYKDLRQRLTEQEAAAAPVTAVCAAT